MIKKMSKGLISWLLVVMIVVSILPIQAFALDDGIEAIEQQMDINPLEETVLLKEFKAQMDEILDKYLGKRVLPLEDVEDAVWSMEEDDLINAWDECEAFGVKAEAMTDAEVYLIKLYESTETFGYFYETLAQIFNGDFAFFAATGTHEPVEGVTVGVSGATDNSMSGGAVTVTAKGSAGIMGYGASAKTATITVYNELSETATLSFDWTASSINELKIDGTNYAGTSGSFSKVLDAGASFVITVTTAKNSTVNKLVMNNFAIVAAKAESKVTFDFDSTLGSVAVSGNAVNTGDVITISKDGAAVVATPASGVTFLGWIDMADHTVISSAASFTLQPADDITVKPVFANKTPWFLINSNSLYEGLNEAVTVAGSVADKTVVLANNATLPAGDYTIPAGVTLLIPRDAANTLYTSTPGTTDASTYVTPTAYRTLTMASGAKITLNGAISIAAIQAANSGLSAPYGAAAFIKMEADSSITVNSGANLYAWGYIMGSGAITVKKGGTAYECFQVTNWRGGTNTSEMVDNKQGVFPLNQYYVQNIEVPMTLEAGAIENGYMSVAITMVGIQGSEVPFIGPNGMFNIISGTITKDYDESTDRLVIDIDGKIGMQSLSLSMKLSIIGTKTIDSEKYELPITNNITVNVKDGGKVTITQDIAILPGAELIVEKGATCELGSGYNIYIYDADEWAINDFATLDAKVAPVKYAPGKPASVPFHNADSDARIHVAGTIDASKGNVYVTASGANITGEEGAVVKLNDAGTQTVTYQVDQGGSDGKTLTYIEIPIKPISLVENENDIGGKYDYINNAWVKTQCTHRYEASVIAPTCTTEGYTAYTCTCGHYYIVDQVTALGHTPGDEATCTTAQTCTVCGTELEAAFGHNYNKVTTAPTCTTSGYTTYTCSVCNDTYTDDEVDAQGHDYEYTNDGETHSAVCNNNPAHVITGEAHNYVDGKCVCGAEEVTECEHNWKLTTVTVNPTKDATGTGTYTCDKCDENKEDIIPAVTNKLSATFGHSISLNSSIEVGFTFKTAAADTNYSQVKNAYASVTKTLYDKNNVIGTNVVEFTKEDITAFPNARNGFTYAGITSKDMSNPVYVIIYFQYNDNTFAYMEETYKLTNYIDGMIAYYGKNFDDKTTPSNTWDEFATMCADLLVYGKNSQIQFEYNTDNYATNGYEEFVAKYATSSPKTYTSQAHNTTLENATHNLGVTLEIGSTISILCPVRKVVNGNNVAITSLSDVVGYKAKCQVVTVDGDTVTPSGEPFIINGEDFIKDNDGNVKIKFSEFTTRNAYKLVEITLCDSEGNPVSNTRRYSISSYTAGQQAYLPDGNQVKILATSIMTFCDSVEAYFSKL